MTKPSRRIEWPDGRAFAFSVLDDTDDATVKNVKPIYDMLHEMGFRTTKTVWPVDCPEGSRLFFAGQTLADADYMAFVLGLANRGFEIAFHGATKETSRRARTLEALRLFRSTIGQFPRVHCNHGQNRENLYWGKDRYQTWPSKAAVALLSRSRSSAGFEGHIPETPHFWGDVALEGIDYVRSFTFSRLPLPKWLPFGPYRLESTPFVKRWFVTSDAPDVEAFVKLFDGISSELLEAHGGPHIVSTHLGKGFVSNGRVDARVKAIFQDIADGNGWLVPVSNVLDHLRPTGADPIPGPGFWRLLAMEMAHISDRLLASARGIR